MCVCVCVFIAFEFTCILKSWSSPTSSCIITSNRQLARVPDIVEALHSQASVPTRYKLIYTVIVTGHCK